MRLLTIPEFNGPLKIEMELHSPDWFTKDNKPRKIDGSNFIKTAIDSVFKHLNVDDSYAFRETVEKIESERKFTVVKISYY